MSFRFWHNQKLENSTDRETRSLENEEAMARPRKGGKKPRRSQRKATVTAKRKKQKELEPATDSETEWETEFETDFEADFDKGLETEPNEDELERLREEFKGRNLPPLSPKGKRKPKQKATRETTEEEIKSWCQQHLDKVKKSQYAEDFVTAYMCVYSSTRPHSGSGTLLCLCSCALLLKFPCSI